MEAGGSGGKVGDTDPPSWARGQRDGPLGLKGVWRTNYDAQGENSGRTHSGGVRGDAAGEQQERFIKSKAGAARSSQQHAHGEGKGVEEPKEWGRG